MTTGQYTYQEIDSQPEVWDSTLAKMVTESEGLRKQLGGINQAPIVVIGCGSTHYLAMHTASILRLNGIFAIHAPSSDLVYFPLDQYPRGFNLLAISRSGTTTETIWAINRYKKEYPNGKVISISCAENTPMAQASHINLIAPSAAERSIAQTRSFSSMVLVSQVLAGLLSGNSEIMKNQQKLPAILRKINEKYKTLVEKLGRDLSIERMFYLGDGPLYGIASEAMLKAKEMSCSWVETYHSLEFRHGPMSLANEKTLIVGLISDSARDAELLVLREMKKLGVRTLAIIESAKGIDLTGIDDVVELNSGIKELDRTALFLPLLQWVAYYRSLEKGLDPDNPVNLSQVVYLK